MSFEQAKVRTTNGEPTRWSGKKWAYAILAMFAFQIGAILLLGERQEPRAQPVISNQWAVISVPDDRILITDYSLWSDPAAFALPNEHGFSRDGWLAFTRPEFRLTDWTEPPQWLKLDKDELGGSLHQFILSNTMPPLLIADKPLPRLSRDDLSVGNAPVPTASELHVEGDLASWTFINLPVLPSWPNTELLTNTVIHTLIDAGGHNIATVLLAGSGSAEADQFALRTAKAARFRLQASRTRGTAPRKIGGRSYTSPKAPISGKLIFKWHTI